MQDLFNSLLLSNSVLTILFALVVAVVVGFNYERDVKHYTLSKIIFNSEDKADITALKLSFGLISLMIIIVTIVLGVKEVIYYETMFATNWWLALLDLILIGFFGLIGSTSFRKIDFRYWIISTFSVVIQLGLTIDFLTFLFS